MYHSVRAGKKNQGKFSYFHLFSWKKGGAKSSTDFDAVIVSERTFSVPKSALEQSWVEHFRLNNTYNDGDEPCWAYYAVWVSLIVLKETLENVGMNTNASRMDLKSSIKALA